MNKKHKKETSIYLFDKLDLPEIVHFVSTREGGVSSGPYNSLNIALHVDDNRECVLKNRKILARNLEIKSNNFTLLKQVHSNRVISIGKEDCGCGAKRREDALSGADAMITNTPLVCLLVQTADCVPLLFYDPVASVVATAHAGWRGTMKQISKNTILRMQKDFHCKSKNIIIGIGPSVGPCCYEIINKKLLEKWKRMYPENEEIFRKEGKKTFLNLWKINQIQLMQSGVRKENIEIAGICTQCCTKEFYSYRRDGVTGRFGSGIMLKNKRKKATKC